MKKLKTNIFRLFCLATIVGTVLSIGLINETPDTADASFGESGIPMNDPFEFVEMGVNRTLGDIAIDGDYNGSHIIAWSEVDEATNCVYYYYQRFDPTSQLIDASKQPFPGTNFHCETTAANDVDVTMDFYGNFVLGYMSLDDDYRISIIDKNLSSIATGYYIGTNIVPGSLSLALNKQQDETDFMLLAVYQKDNTSSSHIEGKFLNGDFTGVGGLFTQEFDNSGQIINPVAGIDNYYPKVAFSRTNAMVTWSYENSDLFYRYIDITTGTSSDYAATMPDSTHSLATGASGYYPSIAGLYRFNGNVTGVDDSFIIAWQGSGPGDTNGIFARKVNCVPGAPYCDPNSAAAGNGSNTITVRVNTTTTGAQSRPVVDTYKSLNPSLRVLAEEQSANDYFSVMWIDESDNENPTLKVQNYTGNMARLGSSYTAYDNPETGYVTRTPDITLNVQGDLYLATKNRNSGFLVQRGFISELFKNVFERKYDAEDWSVYGSDVAVAKNGNYAVVRTVSSLVSWTDGDDVVFTLYDKFGNPIRTNEIVTGTDFQEDPRIAFFTDDETSPHYGKFIVVWDGYGSTDDDGIHYRIYNADGTPEGPEQLANNPTVSIGENSPEVAVGNYGEFIITWFYRSGASTAELEYLASHNGSTYVGTIASGFNFSAGAPTTFDVALNPEANASSDSSFRFAAVWDYPLPSPAINFQQGIFNGTNIQLVGGVGSISNAKLPSIDYLALGDEDKFIISYINNSSSDLRGNIYQFNASGSASIYSAQNNIELYSNPYGSETIVPANISFSIYHPEEFAHGVVTYRTNVNYPPYSGLQTGAQFLIWDEIGSTLTKFGPPITLNNTRLLDNANDFYEPRIAYYSNNTDPANSQAVASYLSFSQDDEYHQTFIDPIALGFNKFLQPEAKQEVLSGGKQISVPTSLDFTDIVRAEAKELPNIAQPTPLTVTVTDLDGSPDAVLSIDISDLSHSTDETAPVIPASNFEMRTYDQSSDTDGTPDGLYTLPGSNASFSLQGPNNVYNAFGSGPLTLGTKTDDLTGAWSMYPQFRLTIPSNATTGTYTGTLTFTFA